MKRLLRILLGAFSLGMLLAACTSAEPLALPLPEVPDYDLSSPPAAILADAPPGSYAFWTGESAKLIQNDSDADPFYSKSGDSGNYAWATSYAMQSLYTAYCTTLDPGYLETYAIVCGNMFRALEDRDGDGFLGWGTGTYSEDADVTYEEFAVHTGLAIKGWADLIMLIRSDPSLTGSPAPGGGTYGELADRLEKAANEHLIPSFDRDYSRHLGVYMNRPGSGNYSGVEGDVSLPHNQYLAMSDALYAMAQVSSEYAEAYTARADAQMGAFKTFLLGPYKTSLRPEDDVVTWNYDDLFFETDYSVCTTEDFSHGMHEYRAAVECYNRGGVFGYRDLERFARNFETRMFNGDYNNPSVSDTVGGGSFGNVPYIYNIMLARYGEQVWQICEGAYDGRVTDAALLLQLHPDAPQPKSFSLTIPAPDAADVLPRSAVFAWTPSQYASDYLLEIALDEDFTNLVVERPYITNISAYVDTLRPETVYYYRVTAHNQTGLTLRSQPVRFTTTAARKYTKKVLEFTYRADIPANISDIHSLRVYSGRVPLYTMPVNTDGSEHRVRLDMTGVLGDAREAVLRIALYRDGADPGEAQIFLDDIRLSGSSDPALDFEQDPPGYIWTRPDYYANRAECGVEDGMLKLRIPSTSDELYTEAYIDVGFSLQSKE